MTVLSLPTFPPTGLLDRLAVDGLSPRLLVFESGLGRDRRLLISSPGDLVRVELLGPLPGLPATPVWHAVRVADGDRAVWCGPPRGSTDALLHRFVVDLIELPTDQLSRHWQRLG